MTRTPTALGRLAAVIALLGLTAMIVLTVLAVASLNVESGDRALHLSYATALVGFATLVSAIVWTVRARRKAGAIVTLIACVLLNPTPLFLLIRAFG
jgi:hypothetical protein